MPDRKTVMSWLEGLTQDDWQSFHSNSEVQQIAMAALELLKEQEAVKPILDAECARMFRCGVCAEYVGFIDSDPGDPNEQDNYCRNCGRKVKWE